MSYPSNYKRFAIFEIVEWLVFQPYTVIFLLLIRASEMRQKFCRIPLKSLPILSESPPKRRGSSTNRAWLIESTPLVDLMPKIIPASFYMDNFMLIDSTIRIYRNNERGKPCRRPLVAWKKFVGLQFIKGAVQGLSVQAFIKFTNAKLNPKEQITL